MHPDLSYIMFQDIPFHRFSIHVRGYAKQPSAQNFQDSSLNSIIWLFNIYLEVCTESGIQF